MDSNFADAYAELGLAYVSENNPKGIENIEKALELNPNSSRANSSKGVYLFYNKRDFEKAKVYLEKALELNPNDNKAHDMMAYYYAGLINVLNKGDDTENAAKALFHINKALAIDPFSYQSNRFKVYALADNKKFQESEDHLNKKTALFQEVHIKMMKDYIINVKSEFIGEERKDRTKTVEFLQKEVKKDPTNINLNFTLAAAYDGIMNDDVNYVKYSKIAYELDTTNARNAYEYMSSLSENGDYKIANELYNSDNFQKIMPRLQKLSALRYLYYNQKNYKKSLETLNDTLFKNAFGIKAMSHAQLGEKGKALSLLKNQNITTSSKAMAYAILKELDSMYSYLNKDDMDFNFINGRREFDPYRNEEKFKDVLKKHYLPNPPIK